MPRGQATTSRPARPEIAPAVEAREVSFAYGRIHALNGLDLTIRRGLIYGLLGPNAAGKSTLIRLIVGLARPQAGAVRVLGEDAGGRLAARIGFMPQSPALYQELSAAANVNFFARVYGVAGRAERRRRVEEILGRVDLTDVANRQIFKMSGGMRQRVSLACALVHEPELMVLDEPTVGLDPPLRIALWELFRRLTDGGKSILVTSHSMDDAAHCDRLGFIREGRMIAEGTPAELRAAAGSEGATLEDAFLHFATGSTDEHADVRHVR